MRKLLQIEHNEYVPHLKVTNDEPFLYGLSNGSAQ